MKKRAWIAAALVADRAVAAAARTTRARPKRPVFITVNLELQPGFVDVGAAAPVQIQTITLESHLKNPTATDPQGFADTQINSYTVRFRRTDGGTRVPAVQTFGAGILVPSGRDRDPDELPDPAGVRASSRPRSTSSCRSTAGSTGRPAALRSR